MTNSNIPATILEFKKKHNYEGATPVIRQYLDLKSTHQDSLLLFRMGDFYELFFEDALEASIILNIVLTKKSKNIQMCGIPHHALDNYLAKLIDSGHKVAICEQLETPEEAKKRGYKTVVKREVVKIFTQGTMIEESLINTEISNYLISIIFSSEKFIICYLDLGISEIYITEIAPENITGEIIRLNPKEIIISESLYQNDLLKRVLEQYQKQIVIQVDSYFAVNKCENIIKNFYKIHSINVLGFKNAAYISAIGAVLEYVNITQKLDRPELPLPRLVNASHFMLIDAATRRNLEITSNIQGKYSNSLFSVINNTVTKQGNRLLFHHLNNPIISVDLINERLESVQFLSQNPEILDNIRNLIKGSNDGKRVLTKISIKKALPRDLLIIKHLLKTGFDLRDMIYSSLGTDLPKLLNKIMEHLPNNLDIFEKLSKALSLELCTNLHEGNFINRQYSPKLLEIYNLVDNSFHLIENLKTKYRKLTSIDNLKINNNNILGLFIEIPLRHASKITDPIFIHKQNTLNAARFSTEELQSLEMKLINSRTMAISLEQEIFYQLCDMIKESGEMIHNLTNAIAKIDVLGCFAHNAIEYNYVRPELTEKPIFNVTAARHPVVERNSHSNGNSSAHSNFTSNDCNLEEKNLWLITGPNMAGKSTFLRQNALVIILAQIGSFVPAEKAVIGVVDKLFSRIGASDDISQGQSTFMIEMIETAAIMAQATENSFILLDEIGRGTSTYDGIAIAQSCIEYIHNNLHSRCLFATHYHELTSLEKTLSKLGNYTVAIKEDNEDILFLHKIKPGSADKSYGIHVAKLAGLNHQIIKRANNILKEIEANSSELILVNGDSQGVSAIDHADDMDDKNIALIIEFLDNLNPDDITARDALDKLYKLKDLRAGL